MSLGAHDFLRWENPLRKNIFLAVSTPANPQYLSGNWQG
jgi:hypothetical protein